jgi:hypothetical protein
VLIFAAWRFIWWLMLSSFVLALLLELPLCLLPSRIRDEEDERTELA